MASSTDSFIATNWRQDSMPHPVRRKTKIYFHVNLSSMTGRMAECVITFVTNRRERERFLSFTTGPHHTKAISVLSHKMSAQFQIKEYKIKLFSKTNLQLHCDILSSQTLIKLYYFQDFNLFLPHWLLWVCIIWYIKISS